MIYICIRNFVREGVLGYGGFGVVHHVSRKVDGSDYALKVIRLQSDV